MVKPNRMISVSYTHLDVYKRQAVINITKWPDKGPSARIIFFSPVIFHNRKIEERYAAHRYIPSIRLDCFYYKRIYFICQLLYCFCFGSAGSSSADGWFCSFKCFLICATWIPHNPPIIPKTKLPKPVIPIVLSVNNPGKHQNHSAIIQSHNKRACLLYTSRCV